MSFARGTYQPNSSQTRGRAVGKPHQRLTERCTKRTMPKSHADHVVVLENISKFLQVKNTCCHGWCRKRIRNLFCHGTRRCKRHQHRQAHSTWHLASNGAVPWRAFSGLRSLPATMARGISNQTRNCLGVRIKYFWNTEPPLLEASQRVRRSVPDSLAESGLHANLPDQAAGRTREDDERSMPQLRRSQADRVDMVEAVISRQRVCWCLHSLTVGPCSWQRDTNRIIESVW